LDAKAFEVRSLRKVFGKRVVLDDLDIEVRQGMCLGLLGANGAGKTTFLKSLLGLIPTDGGATTVLGENTREMSPELRGQLGYVPQLPGQFAWLNGKAMLKYIAAFYPSFDWHYVNSIVEQWKVSLKTPILALSPGQQQRLSIVRALAPRPKLLVLDEPIASLDPATRIAVIDHLVEQQRSRPMTILFSSHITGDLERLCTHFAVMAQGKVIVLDTTETLRQRAEASHKADLEAYLCQWM
jgi:ABC-2 type transport system ATP-binding protein